MTEVREDLGVEELAALVCSTLERHGVRVVLSGGSVVSIHSDNAYQSYDLDSIQTGLARTTNPAMEELGFAKQGRHWLHPRTAFLVEFRPGRCRSAPRPSPGDRTAAIGGGRPRPCAGWLAASGLPRRAGVNRKKKVG